MNTGTFFAVGLMVGVIVMIVTCSLSRKKQKTECEYDEMQLKIRAKGYQIGFYTALLLMMILILLLELNWLTVVTPGFAMFTALLINVTTFAVYCILKDAFLSIRGKANSYFWISGIIIAIEGFVTVRHIIDGDMLENGKLAFGNGAPALTGICFLAILITLIVKTVRNRKEADE